MAVNWYICTETVLLFDMWESQPVLSQLPMGTVLATGHTSEQIHRC